MTSRDFVRVCWNVMIAGLLVSTAGLAQASKNMRTMSVGNYQLFYDRRTSPDDVRLLATALENNYAVYHKKFALAYHGKVKVYVFNSSQRLKSESHSLVYDDAVCSEGRLYVSLPQVKANSMQGSIPRIVAQSLVEQIATCPPWLIETYAIHAGGDYKRFGKPVQVTASTFEDLGEEFSRGARESNARQVFALLAATAKFFADRYGDEKFESVFAQFNRAIPLETAFETAFGEKIADIERAWATYVRSQVKG